MYIALWKMSVRAKASVATGGQLHEIVPSQSENQEQEIVLSSDTKEGHIF